MKLISHRYLGLILCGSLLLTSLEGWSAMTGPICPYPSIPLSAAGLGRLSEEAAVPPLVDAFKGIHTFSPGQSVAMARRAKRAGFLSPWEGAVVPLRFHSDAERTWEDIRNEVESTPIGHLLAEDQNFGDEVDSQQSLRDVRARWLKDPTWKWMEIDLLMNKWVRLKAVRQAGAGVCVTGLSLTQARLIHQRPEMVQNLLPDDPFPVHIRFERHPEASSFALERVGDDLVIRPEGDFPPPDERVLTFVSAEEQREKALKPYREAIDRANAAVQMAASGLEAEQTLSRFPSGSPAVRREKMRLAEARAALYRAQMSFHEKEAEGLRRSVPPARRSSAKNILNFPVGTAFVLGLVWLGWWPLAMTVLAMAAPAFWMAAGDPDPPTGKGQGAADWPRHPANPVSDIADLIARDSAWILEMRQAARASASQAMAPVPAPETGGATPSVHLDVLVGDSRLIQSDAVIEKMDTKRRLYVKKRVLLAVMEAMRHHPAFAGDEDKIKAHLFPDESRLPGEARVISLDGIETQAGWKHLILAYSHSTASGLPWQQDIEKAVAEALRLADAKKASLVTLPLFGLDGGSFTSTQAAEFTVRGIGDFMEDHPQNVQRVSIVVSEEKLASVVRKAIVQYNRQAASLIAAMLRSRKTLSVLLVLGLAGGAVWAGWGHLVTIAFAMAVPAFWMSAGDSFRTHIIPRSVIEKLNEKKYERTSDLMARLCNLVALKDPAGSAFITRQMQLKPGAFIAENGVLEYGFLKLNPESVFEIVYSEGSDFSSASVYLLNRWAAAHAGEGVSHTPQELAKSYRQSLGVVLTVLQRYRIMPGNAVFTRAMRTKPSQNSNRRPAAQKGPALSATVLKEMRYNGLMSLEEIAWLSKEDLVRQLNRLPEFGELAAQEIKKAGHPMADTSIFDRFEVGRIPGLPLGLLVILIKEKCTELKALKRWLQRPEAELLATLEPHRELMGRQDTRLMLNRIRGAYADYRPSGPGSLFPWWRFYTKWLAPLVEMGVPLALAWTFDHPGEATLQHAVLYGGWTMLAIVAAHVVSYTLYERFHPFRYRLLRLGSPPSMNAVIPIAVGIGSSVFLALYVGAWAVPAIPFYAWLHYRLDWRYLRGLQESPESAVPPATPPLTVRSPLEASLDPDLRKAIDYFRSLRLDLPVRFMTKEWASHLERLLIPGISAIRVEWVSPSKAFGKSPLRRPQKVLMARLGSDRTLTYWGYSLSSEIEIVLSTSATWEDLREAILNSGFFHTELLRLPDVSSAEFQAAQRALLRSA